MVQLLWETGQQFLNKLAESPYSSAELKTGSNKNLYGSVHSSFVHNSQKVDYNPNVHLMEKQNEYIHSEYY